MFYIWFKEILNFLRDKHTIVYSIVFPILFYPLLLWGMNQVLMIQKGSLESMPSRVAFTENPVIELIHPILEERNQFQITENPIEDSDITSDTLQRLDIDVVIRTVRCASDLELALIYNGSLDRSLEAKTRIERIVDKINLEKIHGISESQRQDKPDFKIISIDLASKKDKSMFILGIILPMIIVIITVMGGLYPAIEVIVSEKERQTLETTLLAPVSGITLVIGKFLSVITMCMSAAILNIFSILLTLKHTFILDSDFAELDFKIPISAVPLILLGTFLIAAMFSSMMILVASFAKNFKEGQSFVMPIYALGIQPSVISALPGVPFNEYTALVPITNVALLFRELIRGNWDFLPILLTIGTLTIWCLIFLYIAKSFIKRDSFVLGFSRKRFNIFRSRSIEPNDHEEVTF